MIEDVLQAVPIPVLVCGKDGQLLFANSACHRYLPWPAGRWQGHSLREMEQHRIYTFSGAWSVLRDGEARTNVLRDRDDRQVMVRLVPLNSEGRGGAVAAIVTEMPGDTVHREVETDHERPTFKPPIPQVPWTDGLELVFSSPGMKELLDVAARVAATNAGVLLLGESGVGKEVLARLVHRVSPRCTGPFVMVNCGAIPESLFESELFGYEPGAFTGALQKGKQGLMERSNGGSFFLDEIGEMPKLMQVKLLQALQDRSFYRVGSVQPTRVDVRIIAATNRDLEVEVSEGRFRADLYYRINVVPLQIPPLRERREEILQLADLFLERSSQDGKHRKLLSAEAAQCLLAYPWPGNVREIQNLMERLSATVLSDVIRSEDIPLPFRGDTGIARMPEATSHAVEVREIIALEKAQEEVEVQLLQRARHQCRTTMEMARLLGVNQSTIVRKLQRYGLSDS